MRRARFAVDDQHACRPGSPGGSRPNRASVVGGVERRGARRPARTREIAWLKPAPGASVVRLGEAGHEHEVGRDALRAQQRVEQVRLVLAVAVAVLQHVRGRVRPVRVDAQRDRDVAQAGHVIGRARTTFSRSEPAPRASSAAFARISGVSWSASRMRRRYQAAKAAQSANVESSRRGRGLGRSQAVGRDRRQVGERPRPRDAVGRALLGRRPRDAVGEDVVERGVRFRAARRCAARARAARPRRGRRAGRRAAGTCAIR